MSAPAVKLAVFQALGAEPDFSGLALVDQLNVRGRRDFLASLDHSGLSLYLLDRIERHRQSTAAPPALRSALGERSASNLRRSHDMWIEFVRVVEAFEARGVRAATMKGFSLLPGYCPSPELRHQTDFDFLVDPGAVLAAAAALRGCGYVARTLSTTGESYFTTPSGHTPRARDDIFAPQRHRQVDLHVGIWDPVPYFSLAAPADCLARARTRAVCGREILCLAEEDLFLLQVCHLFKHMLRSWIRAAWLFELSRFLGSRRDPEFWQRVVERAGGSPGLERAAALVLLTTEEIFGGSLPEPLRAWFAPAATERLRAWVREWGTEWVAADRPGSLANLLVAREFTADRASYRSYVISRIRPARAQLSSGGGGSGLANRLAGAGYLAHRARKHLLELARMPVTLLRWNRALRGALTPAKRIEVPRADVHAKQS